MAKRYPIDYGNTDIYNFYKKKLNNKVKVSQKVYFAIFDEYISYVKHLMIYNSFRYTLPYGWGSVHFYKYKVKFKLKEDGTLDRRNLRIDWGASKKLWAEMYPDKTPEELKLIEGKPRLTFLNKHSNGYRVRCRWDKTTVTIKHKIFYNVKMLRCFSRELAKGIKEHPEIDYMTFDTSGINYRKIRKIDQDVQQ